MQRYGRSQIRKLRRAGRAAAGTLDMVASRVAPGVTDAEIEAWVRADTARRGGRPSQLGYHGFPHAVCVSINHVVCHGMPSARALEDGDIVNVDVTTELEGFHGDTSRTFCVGDVDAASAHLVEAARAAMEAGIAVVRPGSRLGDVAAAIQAEAARRGCTVVAEYGGHFIGRAMHEAPHVSYVGLAGTGLLLRPGMVFTIEPMINLGGPEVRLLEDGWTVVTCDGARSAQFEHTVLVTEHGVEVLTAGA